jgi:hypothetical protein
MDLDLPLQKCTGESFLKSTADPSKYGNGYKLNACEIFTPQQV